VPSDPPTTVPADYAFCATSAEARAYVIGVVWADGGIAGDTAQIRFDSNERADAAEAAGGCAGITVSRNRDGAEWHLRFERLRGADVNHSGTPPMLTGGASPEVTRAFLAGVIEAEGGRTSGLVVDDTHDNHLNAVPPLLERLDIEWYQRGNKVYAEQSQWPEFARFPFAVYARVPGYGVTWR
jgi:hypothetical protein